MSPTFTSVVLIVKEQGELYHLQGQTFLAPLCCDPAKEAIGHLA